MQSTSTKKVLPKFRYLSAWFCPYAHRATLALEHHKDRIEYEWVEALGWHNGTATTTEPTTSTANKKNTETTHSRPKYFVEIIYHSKMGGNYSQDSDLNTTLH